MELKLIEKNGETILAICLFGANRNPEFIDYHRRIMGGKFGLVFNYIECPFPNLSHGFCANKIVLDTIDTIKPTYYFLCDNDNIFLKKECFDIMYDAVKHKIGIWSAATQSNHKKGPNNLIPHPYASQASLCFPTELFNKLGRPDLDHWGVNGNNEFGGDTCERLTYEVKTRGYQVSLLYPSHSIEANTDLDNGCRFGRGNTYGPNLMFHQMQNNNSLSSAEFISKCQEVLDGKFD